MRRVCFLALVALLAAFGPVKPPVTAGPPAPQPVDWCATKTEDRLRSIRADLGGVRVSFTTSERRGNYLFTPTYPSYPSEVRAKIRAEYKSRGYTHYPIGGMYDPGYPGWAGHDFRARPAEWAALLEELWRDDLIPVVWLLNDGPENIKDAPGGRDNPLDMAKVERNLTPFYSRPDMQRGICVTVLGWEVTDKEWINTIRKATDALAWNARVFPRAYRYWHAAVDNSAPCNYEIDGEGCEGKAWRAMASYLHGQFWQTGTAGGWNLGAHPDTPGGRRAAFLDNLRYEVMRFTTGHYQQGGLRGADGKVIDIIAGEYSAYFELNDGYPEDWGREWGRLALSVPGVRGFGDGGR